MFRGLFQSNILKGTLYTLSGKAVAMIFYMAFDIVCARILIPEDYAEWVFFYAILTMMFYIGWFGINTSAKVFVSKDRTRENAAKTIRASFLLRLRVSIVFGVILVFVAFPLAGWLGYPDKYPGLYVLCLLASFLVFLNSYSEFFKEVLMGVGDFKGLCIITILEFAGYFLFSLIFLIPLRRVEAVAFGYICSGIIVFIFGTGYLRSISKERLFPKKTDEYHSIMKKVFQYAIPIAVTSIGGMILVEMDTFMLGILSTKIQVANYGIAKSLCAKATHVNYALTIGSMTSFSILTVENIKEQRVKFMKINNVNVLLSAVIVSIFLLFGTSIILILYGDDYQEAGRILKYLVPYYFMYSMSTFFATFLDFQGKAKTRSICYCTVVVLNLFFNLLFIPYFGARGAAIATSLSLVPYTVLVVVITRRVIKELAMNNF